MTLVIALLVLGALWFSLRYAWWRPSVDPRCPRILMYHMICEPREHARFNGLRVSPARFEQQLRWLRENGWTGFTISQIIRQAPELPAKAVAITFDDGYADNLTQALPLLKKYNMPATLYLVVERFDRDWSIERKAHHNEGELKDEPKLSDAQVETLLASGLVELGSHSITHANFGKLDCDAVRDQLLESRRRLQARFHCPVESFAYPFGLYKPEHAGLAREAGYTSAVTTAEGIECLPLVRPMEIRRVKISGKDNFLAFRLRMRTGRKGW